jgi:myo-inositol 2-dehydrogenase / D-chiro-inositol 1-dehydrogenase
MVRIGVIGTGMIGQAHIRRLGTSVAGARVVALHDSDPERAESVATSLDGARVYPSGTDLIAAPEVDAVLVSSWGATHEPYVLAAIAERKPVFCEKPLAATQQACSRILDAEVAAGRRLVQVGFMRRYDPHYRALREVLASGSIGRPLLMHAAHRNPSMPTWFTGDMLITDSAVHDLDVARWLFADEIAAITAYTPTRAARAPEGWPDPLVLLVELAGGALVDIEVLGNARFGYDIRGEVVGEDGTAELSESAGAVVKRAGAVRGPLPATWLERFDAAFDAELRDWVDTVRAGGPPGGPSAWDGYAAAVATDAGLAALHSGARTVPELGDKPDLYRAQ